MRGYDREELQQEMEEGYDDYEDEDEYEEEDRERYEEEEDPKPTKEALEYLELRQRLKEQIRKKNLKEGGSSLRNNSSDRKRKLSNDACGSFFGPSQPVISQRVIQESKSFLETQHLNPKVSNPSPHPNKKSTTSSTGSGSKPAVHNNKGRVVNEVRNKAQKLKQTRDYSFLLSDDAEFPAPPPKPAPQQNMSTSGSDSRPASSSAMKSKQGGLVNGARHANGFHGERRPSSSNGHANPKPGLNNHRLSLTSRPDSRQSDSRRPHSSNGNRPGWPLGNKAGLPSKASSSTSVSRSSVPNNIQRRPQPPASRSQPPSRPQLSSQSRPSSQSQHSSLKSKSQHSLNSRQPPPSASRQHLEQRREYQGLNKPKMTPKPQGGGLSRPPQQANRPPLKQNLSRHRSGSPVERPKKKPKRRYSDEEDEDENAISMIRQMFRYNPNKFADRDDDLSDMEANFHDIMREEKRSERAGRAEDEEQLRLIQEEEKRERLAKMKKLRRN